MALYYHQKGGCGQVYAAALPLPGPKDSLFVGFETRKQRKRRSARAGTAFRSRMREKDPYNTKKNGTKKDLR